MNCNMKKFFGALLMLMSVVGMSTTSAMKLSRRDSGAETHGGEEDDGEMEKKVFRWNERHPEYMIRASPKMYLYYDYRVSEFLEKFSSKMGKEFFYACSQDRAETDALKKAVTAYNDDQHLNWDWLLWSPEFWLLSGKRVRFWDLRDMYKTSSILSGKHRHYDGKFEFKNMIHGFNVWMLVPDNQDIQKYREYGILNRYDRERWRWQEGRDTLKSVAQSPANVLKSVRTGGNILLGSSRSKNGGGNKYTSLL